MITIDVYVSTLYSNAVLCACHEIGRRHAEEAAIYPKEGRKSERARGMGMCGDVGLLQYAQNFSGVVTLAL